MSFNREQLFTLLNNVLSPDTEILKTTEQQIKQLNEVSGFTSALVSLLADSSVTPLLQYVATVVLKNHITSVWRKKSNPILSDQEKQQLREQFLHLLTKFDHQGQNGKISTHISVIISSIARVDYPSQWPTLFNSLRNMFEQGNDNIKKSSLNTIKYVINELASRRFLPERQSFYQVSAQLFSYFSEFLVKGTTMLIMVLESVAKQQTNIETVNSHLNSLELLVLVSKILRRVIEYGYSQYQETKEIVDHFNFLFNQLSVLHLYRTPLQLLFINQSDQEFLTSFEKLLTINQKTIIKSQLQQPLSFIDFLPSSLKYFTQQVISYNPHNIKKELIFKTNLVQSLSFLKNVVDCTSYQSEMLYDEDDEPVPLSKLATEQKDAVLTPTHKAQRLINEFFSTTLLNELLRSLVSNCLILSHEELAQWQDDPEQFILDIDSGSDTNAYEIKPCAYSLFILLMRNFHESCVKTVLEMLTYVTSGQLMPGNPLTMEQILLKESCYMTIGLGYYDLFDNVNFEQLFANVFLKELQMQDTRFNIIKRRVCWLVGYWIPKIPEHLKLSVVHIVLELANSDDLVIALTSQDSLRSYIDDYQTTIEEFLPLVDRTLLSILNLFKRVEDVDVKCKLLEYLGSVFIKVNEKIKPYANNIITLISNIWNGGDAPHHLKSAIVRNLTLFLQAMNSDPTEYSSFFIPLIEQSTIPQSEEVIYLVEDALELWYCFITRVNQFSEPLLALFRNLVGIMEKTFEQNEMAIKIIDAYILIGGKDLMHHFGSSIVKILMMLFGDVKDDSLNSIVRPIERILQIYPVEGAVLLQPIFAKIVQLINSTEESELAIVYYYNVFGRLIAMNTGGFFNFMDQCQVSYGPFFDGWFDRIDSIGTSEARKITAIALSNLLVVPRNEMIDLIAPIVTTVVGLRADIDPIDISAVTFSEDGFELPEYSLVDINLKKVTAVDPVNTIDMSTYLLEKMKESSNIHQQNFQLQIQKINPKVLELAFPKTN